MDTQTKVIIGGVVAAALLGYWWYEKKKTAALPAGTPAGAPPVQNAAPNPNSLPAGTPGSLGTPAVGPAAPIFSAISQMAPIAPFAMHDPTGLGAQGMATTFATPSANLPSASAIQVQQWLNDISANPLRPPLRRL